jgi:hypothetical protein
MRCCYILLVRAADGRSGVCDISTTLRLFFYAQLLAPITFRAPTRALVSSKVINKIFDLSSGERARIDRLLRTCWSTFHLKTECNSYLSYAGRSPVPFSQANRQPERPGQPVFVASHSQRVLSLAATETSVRTSGWRGRQEARYFQIPTASLRAFYHGRLRDLGIFWSYHVPCFIAPIRRHFRPNELPKAVSHLQILKLSCPPETARSRPNGASWPIARIPKWHASVQGSHVSVSGTTVE